MADRIILNGIQFYGYHGVPDAEQETGHRYEVDLVLEADIAAAAAADDVEQTVDYGAVAREVLALGTQHRFRLIETLAVRIADQIMASQPRVEPATAQNRADPASESIRKRHTTVAGAVTASGEPGRTR